MFKSKKKTEISFPGSNIRTIEFSFNTCFFRSRLENDLLAKLSMKNLLMILL